MKILSFGSLVVGAFFSLSVQAQTIFTQCNTCNYDYEFQAVAEYEADIDGAPTVEVLISNFEDSVLKKYRVVTIKSFEPGVPDIRNVYLLTPTSEEYEKYDNIIVARVAFTSSLENFEVDEKVLTSAYHMVGSSSNRNKVSEHITDSANYAQRMEVFGASLGQIADKISSVPIVIKVTFDDGSAAYFQAIPSLGAALPLKLIKAVDKDKNDIPLTEEEFSTPGSRNWTEQGNEGLQNWIDAGARLGITISIDGSVADAIETTCTVTPEGLECKPIPSSEQ
ncbi:hypothetical protein [Thalassotalea sp. PS06]|uniref:hypothetical protein n=1 Tax=Thalassotalea sp. PS06 TaxID=2594005 RepID=UPI001162D881|nr:hypothetical protein [Thalassotalea sp. PS06]QDP02668.1 hypothetical protein FNC98_15730 [Thalassotalea sp. PS06]